MINDTSMIVKVMIVPVEMFASQAEIALGFLTSFSWLLSLMLNGLSDLPKY